MQYDVNQISAIILYEKNSNLDGTNYWIRFKKTIPKNPTNIADKAMFWFFYKIKEITIEGDLYSLAKVKTKNNDLAKWGKAMASLALIKNSKLNIFVSDQLQYLIHLVCEVVNYMGQVDLNYINYMFGADPGKCPNTYWSYNPDYPLILKKTIDILAITSGEKDLIEKESTTVKETLKLYNITEERIKVFDTDWREHTDQFYGNIYGSVLTTDNLDDEVKPFKENTANLKTFLKKNYKELYNKLQDIIDKEFIALMNKIYDNDFDYSILSPSNIEYIHKKQQEIFTATQDTVSIISTTNIIDVYEKISTMASEKDASLDITQAAATAGIIAGMISAATLVYGSCAFIGASVEEVAGALLIPAMTGIITAAIMLVSLSACIAFYLIYSGERLALKFAHRLTQLSESERARNEAFADKNLSSLLIKEVALFSAMNKDAKAHEVDVPSPIEGEEFLDEILYHGEPAVREDIYRQIKQILSA